MKLVFNSIIIFCFVAFGDLQAQDLNYYLPKNVTYNIAIPKPADIIHHEVGEWHVTHDKLVNYMYAVAKANPSRIKIERMGFSTERREQVLLTISSPKNIANIENIRTQHLRNVNGEPTDISKMPVVVWIGHSIHGNESSGSNAALVGAYYLAAAQGSKIDSILENTVILYDPSFNPDGLQRFSTWANQHKSENLVTDANSREFGEVWPGGRFNHYWFDLNRDWLPQVHIESRNRVAYFHKWKPNILTDHHEMGSNATFFFQPGVPTRVNPLTPKINQELTRKIAAFHTRALDEIKSLYFTKENYDDFYYGKGSTYPDAQGCVGILFEQASSRGHAQQTANGVLTFPFTIRNQFTTELSTLDAAVALRNELLYYQKDFFKSTASTKTYVYSDANDSRKTQQFTEMLLRNDIDVYRLKGDVAGMSKFNSFAVPLNQKQQTLIRGIFETNLEYKDSIFYDITAWTFPMAFGLNYTLMDNVQVSDKVSLNDDKAAVNLQQASYGYLVKWNEYYAPAALNELLKKGIDVRVATKPFALGNSSMQPEGTLLIAFGFQKQRPAEVHQLLEFLKAKYNIDIMPISTGLATSGVDLGSSAFVPITRPNPALLVGNGVNATDAGEVWFTLDKQMNMQLTQLEINTFNRIEANKYTSLIMVGGSYGDLSKEKVRSYVQNGGVIIATEEAIQWLVANGISDVKLKKVQLPYDSTMRIPYNQRDAINGAQAMSGAIFTADADLTHPLLYGYSSDNIHLFKANSVYMEKSKSPFNTPLIYKKDPLASGWLSGLHKAAINNSAAVVVSQVSSGKIIHIDNNLNFRGFWLGGTKLFMNAIFFGNKIDAGNRGE
jgi:hypothetical protein